MKPLKKRYLILFYIILPVAMVLVRVLYPIRTYNKRYIKAMRGKGFVLAPNHFSAIDPLFVLLGRGLGKKMLIMAKAELFGKTRILDIFWSIAGAFPIERGAGNRACVEQAMAEVRKGRGLLIFPEGTRNRENNTARLKSGAFVVAMEAGVDMVPCHICYKAGRPKPFRRTQIYFGAPVSMEELGLTGEYSPKKLRGAKAIYTEKLEALRVQCEEGKRE